MKFLQTYKRLDHLCRDMNGIGVTGYLEDMEQIPDGAYLVPGWKEDYDQLKYYRHLRNRIAHEVNADEEDLCSAADVAWLEAFYGRILGENDPLVLCRKARTAPSRPDPRLLSHMAAAPSSTTGSQAPCRTTTTPPAAGPSAGSFPQNPMPSICSAYSDESYPGESKQSGPKRPASSPSAPHTGCALWLLFAFCIAMFFLSEFFR